MLPIASRSLLIVPLLLTCPQRHAVRMLAAPRRKGIDAYQTVSVACRKCDTLLFRCASVANPCLPRLTVLSHLTSLRPCMLCADKKKNGLKSALVKCYVERIVEDHHNLLDEVVDDSDTTTGTAGGVRELHCPTCTSRFAREASIHGRPALKMVGGKVRMRK